MRAEIKDLMEKQLIDPRKGFQLLDLGRGVEGVFESQTRHYAKARKENIALEKGEITKQPSGQDPETGEQLFRFINKDGSDVLLPDDDDHAIHIEIHQDLALDVSKPWPVRQNAILMCHYHRQAVDAAAQHAQLGQLRTATKAAGIQAAAQPPAPPAEPTSQAA